MITSFITSFLSSKAITVILMIACVSAGAYISYVIGEKGRLEDTVDSLELDVKSYESEISLLNNQLIVYAKADKASKDKINVNRDIIEELESDDKDVLSANLPSTLAKRMCELGQLSKTYCNKLD